MHEERLFARERGLHRATEQPGGEGGLALIRHVLFAAERAAVRDEFDGDLVGRHGEHAGDVIAVIPHALPTGVHVERLGRVVGPEGRHRQGRLRLEESMVDPLGLEGLAGNMRRSSQRIIDIAAGVGGAAEHVAVEGPHGIFVGGKRRRGSVSGS